MSAIFISHRSSDKSIAATIKEWLSKEGHESVFLDFDPAVGIPAGTNWEKELYRSVRRCEVMIVIHSKAWHESRWCFAEAAQAKALGKGVLPIRIDATELDQFLKSSQDIDMTVDQDEAFVRLRRGLLEAGVNPAQELAWDSNRSPYPGLESFSEHDSGVFFGREKEIHDGLAMLNRMRTAGSGGLIMILGASGSGKSSLARAGIAPRLRRDSSQWLVIEPFRPRQDPFRELAIVFSSAFAKTGLSRSPASIKELLHDSDRSSSPTSANPIVAMAHDIREHVSEQNLGVLLVIDQFEELIEQGANRAADFLKLLQGAVRAVDSPLVVLATMRSDFLEALQRSSALPAGSYETLLVESLDVEGLTAAIEKPAARAGIELEPGLTRLLLDDIGSNRGLPLLAFALSELLPYAGEKGIIEVAHYRNFGGMRKAVNSKANEVVRFQQLDSDLQETLRQTFLRMVRISADGKWTRLTIYWSDIPQSVYPTLEKLVAARLLTAQADAENARTLEVAHEALFDSWDVLAGWLRDSADALRLRSDITIAARSWTDNDCDTSYLWQGTRHLRAMELCRSAEVSLDTSEQRFVAASEERALAAAEAEEELEKARAAALQKSQRRRFQVALSVSLVTSALMIVAFVFRFQAESERERAQEQAQRSSALALAAESRRIAESNPALALALAAESVQETHLPTPQALASLVNARMDFAARTSQPVREPLAGHEGQVWAVAFNLRGSVLASASSDQTIRRWDPVTSEPIGQPLTGHTSPILALAFSPDEDILASADLGGTIRFWNAGNGEQVGQVLGGHAGSIWDLSFNVDGSVMASAGKDGKIRFWNPSTGDPVGQPISGDDGTVWSTTFSPQGAVLASAGDDGAIRLWDPATGDLIGEPLVGHSGPASGVAFSPDGSILASTGEDETIRVWNATTGEPVGQPLTGHSGTVRTVAFSPDGSTLATGGTDGTILRWNPKTGKPLGEPLVGHTGWVWAIAFDSESSLLASASDDRTVRLWDTETGRSIDRTLPGHDEAVWDIAFSTDGLALGSASEDQTIRIWDPVSGELIRQPLAEGSGSVQTIAFSKDGRMMASGSADGTVRLWDPETGDPIGRPLDDHAGWVRDVAFSGDSATLASASNDGRIRLWDSETGDTIGEPLVGHDGAVRALAFGLEDAVLASAGNDGIVQLWDADTGSPIGEPLNAHTGQIHDLSVAPNGNSFASAGDDQLVRLWDAATGDQIGQPLTGHDKAVWAVTFSPDGTLLASASADGTVQLWDAATGDPIGQPLTGHDKEVWAVTFSPDGTLLASASADGTVRLWDGLLDVSTACHLAVPFLTAEQLKTALPDNRDVTVCDLS